MHSTGIRYLCYASLICGAAIVLVTAVAWYATHTGHAEGVLIGPNAIVRNCGVECAAYLAACRVPPLASAYEVRVKARGYLGENNTITMASLQELCNAIGLGPSRALHANMDDLCQLPAPFIAHLDYGKTKHFVVCLAVSDGHLMVFSPAARGSPLITMPRENFKSRFTGAILVWAQPNSVSSGLS